jgi:hypothetical protein
MAPDPSDVPESTNDSAAALAAPPPAQGKKARVKDELLREEEARLKEKYSRGPRRPLQILEADKGFWVFCDDGTVCVARPKKGGTLKWTEAEPPLPGSMADLRAQLEQIRLRAAERAKAT